MEPYGPNARRLIPVLATMTPGERFRVIGDILCAGDDVCDWFEATAAVELGQAMSAEPLVAEAVSAVLEFDAWNTREAAFAFGYLEDRKLVTGAEMYTLLDALRIQEFRIERGTGSFDPNLVGEVILTYLRYTWDETSVRLQNLFERLAELEVAAGAPTRRPAHELTDRQKRGVAKVPSWTVRNWRRWLGKRVPNVLDVWGLLRLLKPEAAGNERICFERLQEIWADEHQKPAA